MAGRCSPALRGRRKSSQRRETFLYEYYWEYAFPHTPTTFALRGDRYKYIYYHGVWDMNEFYDLQTDPRERSNLINVPTYQKQIDEMRTRLFDRLEATGGTAGPCPPRQLASRGTPTAIGRQHDGELVDRGAAAPVPRPTAFRAAPGPLRIPPHFDYGNLMRATTGK